MPVPLHFPGRPPEPEGKPKRLHFPSPFGLEGGGTAAGSRPRGSRPDWGSALILAAEAGAVAVTLLRRHLNTALGLCGAGLFVLVMLVLATAHLGQGEDIPEVLPLTPRPADIPAAPRDWRTANRVLQMGAVASAAMLLILYRHGPLVLLGQ